MAEGFPHPLSIGEKLEEFNDLLDRVAGIYPSRK
jgi:hypothetical protein